jgi:uncharacterized protein YndB with AHSA1/START domain
MNIAAETKTVTVERDFAYPPEKLWRALTTPHLIEEWLMKNDFVPTVGHRFQLRGDWGHADCKVLEIEPLKKLSYTWDAMGATTVVTLTLTPAGAGTHLRVDQAGFAKTAAQAFAGATYGWQNFLAKLDQVAAKA